MKTTVVLRDDIYAFLVNKFGKRQISEAINGRRQLAEESRC